jgi:hypothetical protein
MPTKKLTDEILPSEETTKEKSVEPKELIEAKKQ